MATTFDYTREQLQLTEDLIVRVAGDAGWFAQQQARAFIRSLSERW